MIKVLGVRFKRTGKVYYFDPGDFTIAETDGVIVETARGMEFGEVSSLPHEVPDEQVVQPLKQVIRIASEQDRRHAEANRNKEKEAAVIATEKIEHLGLEMKLVDVEYTFDASKIIFYFTADGRVDFRELIKELAQHFHTRIELRQIGVRDETKMMGGLGPCGREVCCTRFMSNFHPVSIRMAKEQNISLNPTKISGLCGRLMCCLEFEYQHYHSMKGKLPKKGSDVMTPNGPGVVIENNVLEGKSRVRVTLPDKTLDLITYPIEDMRAISAEEREQALKNPEQFKMVRDDKPEEEPMIFADGSIGNDRDKDSSDDNNEQGRRNSKKRSGRNRRSRNKTNNSERKNGQVQQSSMGSENKKTSDEQDDRESKQSGTGGSRKKRRRRPRGGNNGRQTNTNQ